jgi:hypothetical protein
MIWGSHPVLSPFRVARLAIAVVVAREPSDRRSSSRFLMTLKRAWMPHNVFDRCGRVPPGYLVWESGRINTTGCMIDVF